MLYDNVVKILEKCKTEDLSDILVAEDMLKNGHEDDKDLKEACEFLNKYYHQITKCNRLGKLDMIKDICEAKDDEATLVKLLKAVEDIKE